MYSILISTTMRVFLYDLVLFVSNRQRFPIYIYIFYRYDKTCDIIKNKSISILNNAINKYNVSCYQFERDYYLLYYIGRIDNNDFIIIFN